MIVAIICLTVFVLTTIYDIIHMQKACNDPLKPSPSLLPILFLALPIVAMLSTTEIIVHIVAASLLIVREIAFAISTGSLFQFIRDRYDREQWGED